MRVKTWKVLDDGGGPYGPATANLTCRCGWEAELPVRGRPLAAIDMGIVFDSDSRGAIPPVIQCRKCRRIFSQDAPHHVR